MYSDTLTFSPPLSQRTLEGRPKLPTASRKQFSTVSAQLLVDAFKYVPKTVSAARNTNKDVVYYLSFVESVYLYMTIMTVLSVL